MRDPLRHVVEHFLIQLHCLLLIEMVLPVGTILDPDYTVILVLELHDRPTHRVNATIDVIPNRLFANRGVDPPAVYLEVTSFFVKTVEKQILAILSWRKVKIEAESPRFANIYMSLQ